MLQLVNKKIWTFVSACLLHIGMNHYSGKIIRCKRTGEACHFDKPEAHESKSGFINFFTVSGQSINKLSFGWSQIGSIEFAKFIKHFSMTNFYYCSFWPWNFKPYPSDHVLTHIGNKASFWSTEYLNGLNLLNLFYLGALRGYKVKWMIANDHFFPFWIVISRNIPSCKFLICIKYFTIVNVAHP